MLSAPKGVGKIGSFGSMGSPRAAMTPGVVQGGSPKGVGKMTSRPAMPVGIVQAGAMGKSTPRAAMTPGVIQGQMKPPGAAASGAAKGKGGGGFGAGLAAGAAAAASKGMGKGWGKGFGWDDWSWYAMMASYYGKGKGKGKGGKGGNTAPAPPVGDEFWTKKLTEENRVEGDGSVYTGTVSSYSFKAGWGFVKPDDMDVLPEDVKAKIAESVAEAAAKGKKAEDGLLYFRKPDVVEGYKPEKGAMVTFATYTDDKGAGAHQISG